MKLISAHTLEDAKNIADSSNIGEYTYVPSNPDAKITRAMILEDFSGKMSRADLIGGFDPKEVTMLVSALKLKEPKSRSVITFCPGGPGTETVLTITEEGVFYKGDFKKDVDGVYDALVKVAQAFITTEIPKKEETPKAPLPSRKPQDPLEDVEPEELAEALNGAFEAGVDPEEELDDDFEEKLPKLLKKKTKQKRSR